MKKSKPAWLTQLGVMLVVASLAAAVYVLQFQSRILLPELSDESSQIVSSPSSPVIQQEVDLPNRKMLSGGTQVFQTFNNCGPASLSMALSHYGINVSQQVLGQQLRPYQHPQGDNDDKSVTLAELAAKAEEYGFIAYHRPAGTIDILEQFIAQDMPVITRTWLNPGEDIGHYRVVTGYDQTTSELIQDDSLQGRDLKYSYDRFNEIWRAFNYEFLVLVPAEKQAVAEQILAERLAETTAWEMALTMAEAELSTNPNDLYAGFNQSVALYHLGRYPESVMAFEKVKDRLPPRMLWYQLEPVLAYYQVGEFQTVLSTSEDILGAQNRAYSELYYLRALVFEQQGQSELAQAAYADAGRYNSTSYWKVNLEGKL